MNAIRAQAHQSVQYPVTFRQSIAKFDKYHGNEAVIGGAKTNAKKAQWVVTVMTVALAYRTFWSTNSVTRVSRLMVGASFIVDGLENQNHIEASGLVVS